MGGDEADADVWRESRERQGAARGRVRFAPGALAETLATLETAVVRPAAGVAYVPEPVPADASEAVERLTESIRRAFDPRGVLSG